MFWVVLAEERIQTSHFVSALFLQPGAIMDPTQVEELLYLMLSVLFWDTGKASARC